MQRFSIPLHLENKEKAAYRLKNDVDESGGIIPHRSHLIGFDHRRSVASTTVNGSMPIVLHGNHSSDGEPRTLLVFDWDMPACHRDQRIREVHIEVVFKAHGDRGDAESIALQNSLHGYRDSSWDPEVVGMAPVRETWYKKTSCTIQTSQHLEIAPKVTAGLVTVEGLKYSYTKSDSGVEKSSAITISGKRAIVGRSSGGSNAVRWEFLENAMTKEGVPSFVRTAVLLKRQRHDNGKFQGTLRVEVKLSPIDDLKRNLWDLIGVIPRDDPVLFDPKEADRPEDFHKQRDCLDQINLEEIVIVEHR